jgi:hypothetical protein
MGFETQDSPSQAAAADSTWASKISELFHHDPNSTDSSAGQSDKDSQITHLDLAQGEAKAVDAAHDFVAHTLEHVQKALPDPEVFGFHRVSNFSNMLDKGTDMEKLGYGAKTAGGIMLGVGLLSQKPGPVMFTLAGVASGALGVSTYKDYCNYESSTSDRNRLVSGVALGGDAALAAGLATRMISRSVPLAATLFAVGAVAKIGSDFIPNHREFQWPWQNPKIKEQLHDLWPH